MILKQNAVANMETLMANGHTQAELAQFAGVSRVQINRILNGHSKPEIDTCEALAVAFDLPPEALLLAPAEFSRLLSEKLVAAN